MSVFTPGGCTGSGPERDTLYMDTLALVAVSIVTAAVGLIVVLLTRGVTFGGTNTDNEKQLHAAAMAAQWRWPSDMHGYGGGKTRMKDVFVIGLAIMQRILRDRTSDYPTVVLCIRDSGAWLRFCGSRFFYRSSICHLMAK